MRRWWKSVGLLAGGLVGLGGILSSASAQFPPPGSGGFGMPPGGGMMGPPPGMVQGRPTSMGMPPSAFGGPPDMGGQPAEFPNAGKPSSEPTSPFSLKDEGAPNAFNCDQYPYVPLRFQISAGYVFTWFRGGNFPPLTSTGSVNDQPSGALGQPNTVLLTNGVREPGLSSAFRTSITYWLKDPEVYSLDADFFIMEQRTLAKRYESDGAGVPLLARPYFNVGNGAEDAQLFAIPGVLRGTVSDSVRTRLMSADVNLKWHSSPNLDGAHFAFLTGVRWFRLDERYLNEDTSSELAPGGSNFTTSDTFTTYNQFFGAQLGLEYKYRMGRFTFELLGKVAVGPNYETIKIAGESTRTNATTGTNIVANDRGSFAQPGNVGNYNRIQLAVVPELSVKSYVELTDHLKLHVGYSLLFLNKAVRPGDQIDRVLNIQPVGVGIINPPLLPGPPSFRNSTFSVQMLNLGLEFCF